MGNGTICIWRATLSTAIDLAAGVEQFELWIDNYSHVMHFKAKLGTEENDLFDDLF